MPAVRIDEIGEQPGGRIDSAGRGSLVVRRADAVRLAWCSSRCSVAHPELVRDLTEAVVRIVGGPEGVETDLHSPESVRQRASVGNGRIRRTDHVGSCNTRGVVICKCIEPFPRGTAPGVFMP